MVPGLHNLVNKPKCTTPSPFDRDST